MSVKYITATQAEQIQRRTLACYDSNALRPIDKLRLSGVLGVVTTDYYVVPDDDPRLQSPDRISDTERTE